MQLTKTHNGLDLAEKMQNQLKWNQVRHQLRHQAGRSVFWEGPKIFNFVHFSREAMPIFKSCIKIQENWVDVDLMVNALQSTWNLDRNNLHAYVRQCAHPFDLPFAYLSFSCSGQSFDVRIPSFLSHSWIPATWWVNNAAVGVLLKVFCVGRWYCFPPITVGRVQTPIL